MKNLLKLALFVFALGALASPALAVGPGTGEIKRQEHAQQKEQADPDRPKKPSPVTSPRSKRALGVVCKAEGASKSNADDPERGTPFSRCVKLLAQANKKACSEESQECTSELAQGLRASTKKTKSDRRQARIACARPDFDSGREFGRCVSIEAKALRRV